MSEWNMWKSKFGKVYETFEEEVSRMEQWLSNMAHIEAHNFEYALGHKTFSLGMNHYGDLSSAEFAAQYNGFLNSKKVAFTHFSGQKLACSEFLEHFFFFCSFYKFDKFSALRFSAVWTSKKGMHVGEAYTEHEGDDVLEKTVDWRTEGAVSDVKDQGKPPRG